MTTDPLRPWDDPDWNDPQWLRSFLTERFSDGPDRVLSPGKTEICFDAFPRSGNSYLTRAIFCGSTLRNQAVGHHTHRAEHLQLAILTGVPAMTIIREPLACLASLHVYNDLGDRPNQARELLKKYKIFYGFVRENFEKLTVFTFDRVINDPLFFLREVCAATRTQLSVGSVPELDQAIKSSYGDVSRLDANRIGQPDASRAARNEAARAIYQALGLEEADALYGEVCRRIEEAAGTARDQDGALSPSS